MNTLSVTTREEWRAWLAEHHASEREIWLIYYKKISGRPRIPYDDAVEEAICFGWIDSIVKRLDDERFAQKFTPRTNTAKWSEINKRRLHKMIAEGRMTPAGTAKIGKTLDLDPSPAASPVPPYKQAFALSPDLEAQLRKHRTAWDFYQSLPPSQQKLYVRWIMSAKKDETRANRMQEAIERLANKQRLGLK